MFNYFSFKRKEFPNRWHKRPNIDSTVSMFKAKFRAQLRGTGEVAKKNEVFCKIVCRNMCCLIQEMNKFGIEPTFWK